MNMKKGLVIAGLIGTLFATGCGKGPESRRDLANIYNFSPSGTSVLSEASGDQDKYLVTGTLSGYDNSGAEKDVQVQFVLDYEPTNGYIVGSAFKLKVNPDVLKEYEKRGEPIRLDGYGVRVVEELDIKDPKYPKQQMGHPTREMRTKGGVKKYNSTGKPVSATDSKTVAYDSDARYAQTRAYLESIKNTPIGTVAHDSQRGIRL